MASTIIHEIEAQYQRLTQARQLVAADKVKPSTFRGTYLVQGKQVYLVQCDTCTCPDSQYRDYTCKHVLAVQVYQEQLEAEAQSGSPGVYPDCYTDCARCGLYLCNGDAGGRCLDGVSELDGQFYHANCYPGRDW